MILNLKKERIFKFLQLEKPLIYHEKSLIYCAILHNLLLSFIH